MNLIRFDKTEGRWLASVDGGKTWDVLVTAKDFASAAAEAKRRYGKVLVFELAST